jgi:AcrR family transcriptional regulator
MAKRKEINEQKLLNVALRAFSQKRYDEVSLNDIINEAGLSKGSFYYRYADKFDLYLTLLKKAVQAKWEFISTRVDSEKERDFFTLLKRQASVGREFILYAPEYAALAERFAEEKGSWQYERATKELYEQDRSGLSERIEREYERGSFHASYQKSFIQRIIPSLFSLYNQILQPEEDPEELLDQLMGFLKRALQIDATV